MPELGSLWYSVGLKDLTDADIKKINEKLKNLGSDLLINPKLAKSVTEILPKGIKLELEPQLKAVSNEALAKAVEGKVMKVEIAPLLTNLRKALKDATKYITLEVCEYRNHIAKFTVLDGAKKGEDPLGISSLIILPLIIIKREGRRWDQPTSREQQEQEGTEQLRGNPGEQPREHLEAVRQALPSIRLLK